MVDRAADRARAGRRRVLPDPERVRQRPSGRVRAAQLRGGGGRQPAAAVRRRVRLGDQRGPYINALFKLTDRSGPGGGTHGCGSGAGTTARVNFIIINGKITHWLRAPSQPGDNPTKPPAAAVDRDGDVSADRDRDITRHKHRPARDTNGADPAGDADGADHAGAGHANRDRAQGLSEPVARSAGTRSGHDHYDSETMAVTDPYKVLGIPHSATDAEIRAAYRRQVQLPSPGSQRRLAGVDPAVRGGAGGLRADRQAPTGQRNEWGDICERASQPPPPPPRSGRADPGVDARLAELDRELKRQREAKQQAQRKAQRIREDALRQAREAARADGGPTDEDLGYVTTDDSFSAILDDAASDGRNGSPRRTSPREQTVCKGQPRRHSRSRSPSGSPTCSTAGAPGFVARSSARRIDRHGHRHRHRRPAVSGRREMLLNVAQASTGPRRLNNLAGYGSRRHSHRYIQPADRWSAP